jgi:RNA polymerase sigma factor (sigma-70 family)
LLTLRMEQACGDASALLKLTTNLARGDDSAWGEFHRTYGPALFRQLLAATRGDHDLASEALQQSYLRIARHARPCASEGTFRAWLRVVGRSALSDCRRRRFSFWQLLSRRRDDPTGASDSEPDGESERIQALLDHALALLEPEERALLTGKYFAGTPVRSLAEQLGISEKATESRLTRARAELRRHFTRLLEQQE